jgi:hypothetical protein
LIPLSDVTVVVIDSVAHELANLAIKDTLQIIAPAEVLVFSDKMITPGTCFVERSATSLREVAKILWHEVPWYVETSHLLIMQWDGWVIDGSAWTDEFLAYDYIGAVWPWHKRLRVGNGGFSLRSHRLMSYLAENHDEFPIFEPEDNALCRYYRAKLEARGFTWAPEELAARFSIECSEEPAKPFGFHDVRNWPRLLPRDVIARRITSANNYVRSKIGFEDVVDWIGDLDDNASAA